ALAVHGRGRAGRRPDRGRHRERRLRRLRRAHPRPPDHADARPGSDRVAAMSTRTVRAPRGTALHCLAWPQEAAFRMIQNNLDPDVAERPSDLVVYGGTGRAARSWDAFERILATLRR